MVVIMKKSIEKAIVRRMQVAFIFRPRWISRGEGVVGK
jgi:hypothetical protein